MSPILVDDTQTETDGDYGPEFTRELARISQYRTTRREAYRWARNLRFLVYDNTGTDESDEQTDEDEVDEADEYEAPPSDTGGDENDAELQRAIELSLQTGGQGGGNDSAPHHASDDDSEDEETKLERAIALSLTSNSQSQDQDQSTASALTEEPAQPGPSGALQLPSNRRAKKSRRSACDNCLKNPRFPKRKQATNFRVVRLDPEGPFCHHYVAVSYCWSAVRDTTCSYKVRITEDDGTVTERQNRTPDEVIDRAVEFARRYDARLIWLDQECLPQDRSKEQENGIQAMDLVYQQAYWCVGLLESVIPSQSYLDSAMSVFDWARSSPRQLRVRAGTNLSMQEIIQNLTGFLDLVARDPWNQRAWILQERFSSTTHMVLAIRTTAPFYFQVPQGHGDATGQNVFLLVSELDTLTQASSEFFDMAAGRFLPLGYTDMSDTQSILYSQPFQVLARLRDTFPDLMKTNNPLSKFHALGGGNFGPRRKCNAAVALSFLRGRSNSRPADRLAILANLCDYEIRLNTTAIEDNFESLTTCMLALTVLNGDLSLLVPDVYGVSDVKGPDTGPSWALPFHRVIPCIKIRQQRQGLDTTIRIPNLYTFTDRGLVVPGYVWTVDRAIDLAPVQLKWKQEWVEMSCVAVGFEPREGEGEDFETRRNKVRELVRGVSDDLKGLGRPSPVVIPPHIMDQLRGLGCTVWRKLPFEMLRDPTHRLMVGKIMFDILWYLYAIGERSVANSVWQSIRTDFVAGVTTSEGDQQGTKELPDDVADLLADASLVSDPWKTLQLNKNAEGALTESWLINRIMEEGMLWIGKYAGALKESEDGDGASNEESPPPENAPKKEPKSIVQHQLVLQASVVMMRSSLYNQDEDDTEENVDFTVGSLVALQVLLAGIEGRSRRLASREAVFNVDGPCTVVTPYDGDMEWIPQSALRSMDSCWVVESVECAGEHVALEQDAVRGRDEKGKGRLSSDEEQPVPDTNRGRPIDGKFRVLGRVQGMWAIMEIPTERYEFV